MTLSRIASAIARPFTNQAFRVQARLQHPNGDPLTHQKVKVCLKRFLVNQCLGSFHSNRDGVVNLNFSARPMFSSGCELVFKVYEEKMHRPGQPAGADRLVHTSSVQSRFDALNQGQLTVPVELYEYQEDLPMLQQPEVAHLRPQQWTLGERLRIAKAAISEIFKNLRIRLGGGAAAYTLEQLMDMYPPREDRLALIGSNTIEVLLNGIYPCHFQPQEGEGAYMTELNWDGIEQDPRSPVLPNGRLFVQRSEDGQTFHITGVEIKFNDEQEYRHYAPTDGNFRRALYMWNCAALVMGECKSHLGIGHVWTEQAAMAAARVNRNPIKRLVGGPLEHVMEINRRGASDIFGPKGVLNVSALTVGGIRQVLKKVLGEVDYADFAPPEALVGNHRFARAQQIFWRVVNRTVEEYFAQNNAGIIEHWYEIYYMSKNLVEHSCEFNPTVENGYDQKERAVIDGTVKAITPITTSLEGPQEGDMDRLKQFIRFTLFTSTFWHSTVHESQAPSMLSLGFGSLAPERNGPLPYADMNHEGAHQQLRTASVLTTYTEANPTVRITHESQNVHPIFLANLERERGALLREGVDIDALMPAVVI